MKFKERSDHNYIFILKKIPYFNFSKKQTAFKVTAPGSFANPRSGPFLTLRIQDPEKYFPDPGSGIIFSGSGIQNNIAGRIASLL
jgi:hypothetical protein